MLVGNLQYDNYKYNIKGKDTSSNLRLVFTSSNYDAIQLMSGSDVDDDDALWSRTVDIKMQDVTVETKVTLNEEGKKIKTPINQDFFCSIGALIRYVKSHCYTKYANGFLGIQLASGDFSPEADTTYTIPFETNSNTLATITLSYGNIKELSIQTDRIKVELHEDSFNEDEVLLKPTDGIKKGFKFDKDYLGFDLQEQVLEDTTTYIGGMYTSLEEIIKNHPEKEFSWLLEKDYQIVTDENLEEVCDYIYNYDGYVYFDTETTGLNINFKSRIGQADQCVGIILSVVDGESFYFPMQMKCVKNLCGGDHFYFMEHYMRRILEQKDIVVHNLAFDWKVAYIYDINCNIVDDTQTMLAMTLAQEYSDLSIALKSATKMFLHRDAIELDDIVVGNEWDTGDVKFWDLPAELVKLYACADTDDTRGLHRFVLSSDLLTKYNASKIYEIELAFSYAVAYQEFYGHHQDINNIENLKKEVHEGIDDSYAEMVKIIGHDFNPNSPKQLVNILYTELGIPEQISRKTGKVTTDKDTLKHLGDLTDIEGNTKYPFVKLLLKYREYEGVRKLIDKFPEVSTQDGYLFSHVMQYGASTGRVSINTPNYQSYNDPVKKNIIPRPGYYMFDTDYSSVEYRVLGNMCGNKMIKENFYDPDFDYHTYQAARMYGVPYASVTGKLRKAAKGINFGLPYGMGDESLGIRIFGEASETNTRKAAQLRRSYFKGQEDIEQFFTYHRSKGVANNFTETYFGRRRYYDRTRFSVASIRRQAGNAVIQGTAADIYKIAVGRVFKRICKEGWLGKVLLSGFIHDELLGEVSTDIDPMVFLKALREEFEVKVYDSDGSPWCPLYMGFGWGMSWYQAKKTEVPIKLQWEFVEKYGENGYPLWDGDGKTFCDSIPDKIRDFNIRDSRIQILSEEAQGKEIKPALNSMILDILKEDKELYDNYMKDHDTIEEEDIEVLHIQKPYTIDGVVQKELPKTDETQEALNIFCIIHDADRSKVNILNIAEVENSSQLSDDSYDFDEENTEEMLQLAIDNRIETLGMYVDLEKKEVHCKLVPENYMQFIKQRVVPEGSNEYKLFFKDTEKKVIYTTTCELPSAELGVIQSMYIQYMKAVRG